MEGGVGQMAREGLEGSALFESAFVPIALLRHVLEECLALSFQLHSLFNIVFFVGEVGLEIVQVVDGFLVFLT